MKTVIVAVIAALVLVLVLVLVFALAVRIIRQYERGVVFRFGRLRAAREPGFGLIIPLVDVLHRVSLRVVTMPVQSQGIITKDNVSVGVSAVAYCRVVDPVKPVVAIENVADAIGQVAQATLRKVAGQHTLDQTLAETDQINLDIRKILDVTTAEWGVAVTLVESMYGNTHLVADAIGVGLGTAFEVSVVPVSHADPAVLADAELVVAGGPTHVHGMSRAATRKAAVEAADKPVSPLKVEADALGPGLRDWFGSLGCYPVKAAAFDTRMHGPATLTGRASKGVARLLREHGFDVIAEPESFLVTKQDRLEPRDHPGARVGSQAGRRHRVGPGTGRPELSVGRGWGRAWSGRAPSLRGVSWMSRSPRRFREASGTRRRSGRRALRPPRCGRWPR
jgi:SPFH domain / Band 7 family